MIVWVACLAAIALVSLADDARGVPVVARLRRPSGRRRHRRVARVRRPSVGAAGRAGDRVVGEPLQLHGRQRRPRRHDGDHRASPPTRRAALHAGAPVDVPCARRGRRRCRSSRSTARRRACSWATSARCRSASWPRRSASAASSTGHVGAWFPLLVFLPFVADAIGDARAARAARRARLGGRTAATTTSASTGWAPAIAERSRSTRALMAGAACARRGAARACDPAAGWARASRSQRRCTRGCSRRLIIIGGKHARGS